MNTYYSARPGPRWLLCFFLGASCSSLLAQEKKWERDLDEKQLLASGVSQKTEALLQYVKRQILSPARRDRILQCVVHLGHDSWRVREEATTTLIEIGRLTLPFLRSALQSPDRERVRRAQQIKVQVQATPHRDTMMAVVRTLSTRNEPRAVPILLDCLPWVSDDQERQVFQEALVHLGLDQGRARKVIVAGVRNQDPTIRAACALVLGKAQPLPRGLLGSLLKDKDPEPRYCAARSLIHARDRSAVPVLIDLIGEMDPQQCWQVEDVLFQIAFDTEAPLSLHRYDTVSRQKSVESWKAWWSKHAQKLDLTRVCFEQPVRGYTLYCEYDGGANDGCVWMAGRDGKPRWEISGLVGPNDAQLLANGRVLVAERNAGRVTERDRKGNVLWEHEVSGGAIACERLQNGKTLITTWVSILLVDRSGKELWKYTHPRGMRSARQVRGRRILGVAASGEVFFLNEKGELLQRILPERHGKGAGYWASAELLPNNHLLVALGSSEKVVEIDQKGKIVWEVTVPNAVYATRLRDGHTLICNFEERLVIKLDRSGREVDRQHLQGRPFVVRRY